MSADRWRVYRLGGRSIWVAQRKGAFKTWRLFCSWREAYTYADREARNGHTV